MIQFKATIKGNNVNQPHTYTYGQSSELSRADSLEEMKSGLGKVVTASIPHYGDE